MTNYKSRNFLSLIEHYAPATTWTTKTFTFPSTTNQLHLHINGGTTASLALLLQVNGVTGGTYYYEGARLTGTVVGISATTQTSHQIASTTILGTVRGFIADITIDLAKDGQILPVIKSEVHGTQGSGIEILGGFETTTATGISSITVLVSTSSLQADTTATLYEIKS